MESKIDDVKLTLKLTEQTIDKWDKVLNLWNEFDSKISSLPECEFCNDASNNCDICRIDHKICNYNVGNECYYTKFRKGLGNVLFWLDNIRQGLRRMKCDLVASIKEFEMEERKKIKEEKKSIYVMDNNLHARRVK